MLPARRLFAPAATRSISAAVRAAATTGPAAMRPLSSTTAAPLEVSGRTIQRDDWTNVTPHILAKVPRALHRTPHHPVALIAKRIEHYWQTRVSPEFTAINNLDPVVSTTENFDHLLFPKDHPGRSRHDSYYLNRDTLLRTHTSAHQTQLLTNGTQNFLLSADCYRRDEIDASHYPVFHQMEGFRTFDAAALQALPDPPTPYLATEGNPQQATHDRRLVGRVAHDLQSHLDGMVQFLFAQPGQGNLQVRWIDAYFPFTAPSWEMEVQYQGKWLELLGCGVVQQPIFQRALGQTEGAADQRMGWAFGLGLERLAMVLFRIPDIRLFWSTDPRFLDQFGKVDPTDPTSVVHFTPFSHFPPCLKDVAFWLPEDAAVGDKFHDNSMFDLVRDVAHDLVENVALIDEFTNKKGRKSKCFRITYRSMDRNVTNEEINAIQAKVRQALAAELKVELR
ncbi:phenylalanine-tRNA ligase [Allomyces macrogynus ATCC 38327]|uniref:Phenylalanine--tRNA ligase, mitochondrial n=1 Tax=Allomyces macrogynus (strain ATCC 38327) TaxID=578462 RepID=A0A0L0SN01_ALLM3|nr:phenylalanine-tRNA ligase [Allomyces macrogynus ATCC 38327]|eukprot:KNE63921.1 phenylalanine-tRNA ligase [Allomyces macrogynus ATCC 38327]